MIMLDFLAGWDKDLSKLPIEWRPRIEPRRFGKVMPGEIGACRQVCLVPMHSAHAALPALDASEKVQDLRG